eukprot:6805061-Alexandrium_andersonii.AAC.1
MAQSVEGGGPRWGWAAGDQNIGMIKLAVSALESRLKDGHLMDIILEELRFLKGKGEKEAEKLLVRYKAFLGAATEVAALEKAVGKIWKMHKARDDA